MVLQLKSSKCHLFRESVPFLGHIVGRRGLECDPKKIEDVKSWPVPRLSEECATVSGICGILPALYPEVCRCRDAVGAFDGEGCAVCVGHQLFSRFPGFACFH